MKFEWDENKNQKNFQKHRMFFDYAKEIFSNEFVMLDVTREADKERREKAIGYLDNILIVVVHTIRDDAIRIISARKANPRETMKYYENNTKNNKRRTNKITSQYERRRN